MKINFNSRKLRKTVAIISLWVMVLSSTNVSAIVNRTYRDVEEEVKAHANGNYHKSHYMIEINYTKLESAINKAVALANYPVYMDEVYTTERDNFLNELGAYIGFLKKMQLESENDKTQYAKEYSELMADKQVSREEKIQKVYLSSGLEKLTTGEAEYIKDRIDKLMKKFMDDVSNKNRNNPKLAQYDALYHLDGYSEEQWYYQLDNDLVFKEYATLMARIYNKERQILAILKTSFASQENEAKEMLELQRNMILNIKGKKLKNNDIYNEEDENWDKKIVNVKMAEEANLALNDIISEFFKTIGKKRPKNMEKFDYEKYDKVKNNSSKRDEYLNELKRALEQQVEEASVGMEIKPLEIIKEVPNNSPKWNMDVDAEDDDSLDRITMLTKAQIERLNKLGINFDNIDFNDKSKVEEIIAKLGEENTEEAETASSKATGVEDRDRIEQNTEKEHYEDVKKTEAAAPIAKVENEGSHLVLQGTISKAEDFKVMEQNIEIEAKIEETGAVASEQASEVKIVEKSEAAQQALRIEQQGKENPPHSIISPVSASDMGQKVSEAKQVVETREVKVLEEQHTDAEQTRVEVDDKRASQVIDTAPESIYERIRFNLPEADSRENLSPRNLNRIHTAIGEFSERSNRTMDMLRNGDKDVSLEDQEKIKRLISNGGNVRKDLDVILGAGKEDEVIDKLVEHLKTGSNDLNRIYRQYNPENKKYEYNQ